MRPYLLFASLAGLTSAANLDIWEVDATCDDHRDALQKSYDDSAVMAAKAVEDLSLIQENRGHVTRSNPLSRIVNWDLIARITTKFFGFEVDQGGVDPNDEHLQNVLCMLAPHPPPPFPLLVFSFLCLRPPVLVNKYKLFRQLTYCLLQDVYNRMNTALQGSQNVPAGGYAQKYSKALIMCGDKPWKWYGRDDKDPNDPAGRPMKESRADELGPATGAWVYGTRYIVNGNPGSVGICRPGVHAVTMTKYDMIVFCDSSFTSTVASAPSPVDIKDHIQEGSTKMDEFGQFSLSRIMIHELAHWYGAGGDGTKASRNGM